MSLKSLPGDEFTVPYLRQEFVRYGLPDYMVTGTFLYLTRHISPGSFLLSVLRNDFCMAVANADEDNQVCLAGWVKFLYNRVPSQAWGSPENVKEWLAKREVV